MVPFIDVLLLYELQVWKHQNIKFKSKTKNKQFDKVNTRRNGELHSPTPCTISMPTPPAQLILILHSGLVLPWHATILYGAQRVYELHMVGAH